MLFLGHLLFKFHLHISCILLLFLLDEPVYLVNSVLDLVSQIFDFQELL